MNQVVRAGAGVRSSNEAYRRDGSDEHGGVGNLRDRKRPGDPAGAAHETDEGASHFVGP